MEGTGAVVWSRLIKNFSKDREYFLRSQENFNVKEQMK